jgi:hypothetical protein
MWQLRRLSTNEALSEAGPLPNNWGPIFGLHGFLEKIGDLSWIGSAYAGQGWVKLTESEELAITSARIVAKAKKERADASKALDDPSITVGQKIAWNEYLLALDEVCICAEHECRPHFPVRPDA